MRTLRRTLLTIFAIALATGPIYGNDRFQRAVELEWEPVDGATLYELEMTRILPSGERKKPVYFKQPETAFNGKINPGRYEMRLRSFDRRSVPGSWSEPSEFWAQLPSPPLKSPVDAAQIKTSENETTSVEFQWEPIEGALKYKLVVQPEGASSPLTTITERTSHSFDLPVAVSYKWHVVAMMLEETDGAVRETPANFTLIGKPLTKPAIKDPRTKFVNKLEWTPSAFAETYAWKLSRLVNESPVSARQRAQNRERGKVVWKEFKSAPDAKAPSFAFDSTWPGGRWRLDVTAKAPLREDSPTSSFEFDVWDGDRSPAAVERAMLIESIEKPNKYYAIASYLITQINYTGTNYETATNAKFTALGGTGRVGFGYHDDSSRFGWFAISDFSGFTVGQRNHTFATGELHLTLRHYFGTKQFLLLGGPAYRELPAATGNSNTGEYAMKKISWLGPHVGFQYWVPFSYRFGIQLMSHIYSSWVSVESPNGRPIEPSLSYTMGLRGSYRLAPHVMGYAGYVYRDDNASYPAVAGSSSSSSPTFANPGDVNRVIITGHYFNLLLEYGF